MKVSKHLGVSLLTEKFICEYMIETHFAQMRYKILSEPTEKDWQILRNLIFPEGSKNYIVADTVMKSLELLKLKKPYNYSVFKKMPNGKKTFLLPNNEVIKISKQGEDIRLGVIWEENKGTPEACCTWNFWAANLETGKSSMDTQKEELGEELGREVFLSQFESSIEICEHKAFALMCFMFLSDIIEEEIAPHGRKGTRKSGKILNDTDLRFTAVNTKWNITSVRTDDFTVSGHFALRWVGVGRSEKRIVWIEPFQKHGYVRKAASQQYL